MPFTFSKAQKLVSLFVIVSFFLLLAISIFIFKGNKLFVKKVRFHTFLNQTYGLSSGSSLKYKGIDIGKVTGVKLTNQYKILLNFSIYEKYRKLFREETVLKVASGLIGSATLTVQPDLDKTHNIRPENSLIYSSDMSEGIKILNRNIKKVEKGEDISAKASQVLDMIAEMKPKIYNILDKLNRSLDKLNVTLDTFKGTASDIKDVSASLKGEGETRLANKIFLILDNLNNATLKANSLISKFSSPENSIGKFLSDKKELYNKIDKILENLRFLLENFQDLPDDIKDILEMTKENLVQLKYVLENVPLIPKKSQIENVTITSENR